MRGSEVARLFLGSMIVYVVTAACGSGGGNGSGTSGDGGEALDALTNPVPDAVADTGGSRIKIRYWVGADGSKVSAGAHDSMLDVACLYGTAADGSTRCLPYGTDVADASLAYADASCTAPLATVDKGCAAPKYAVRVPLSTTACPSSQVAHVYPLGAPFTSAASIYESTGSSCIAVSASNITGSSDLYQVGPELPICFKQETGPSPRSWANRGGCTTSM